MFRGLNQLTLFKNPFSDKRGFILISIKQYKYFDEEELSNWGIRVQLYFISI